MKPFEAQKTMISQSYSRSRVNSLVIASTPQGAIGIQGNTFRHRQPHQTTNVPRDFTRDFTRDGIFGRFAKAMRRLRRSQRRFSLVIASQGSRSHFSSESGFTKQHEGCKRGHFSGKMKTFAGYFLNAPCAKIGQNCPKYPQFRVTFTGTSGNAQKLWRIGVTRDHE